MILSADVLKAYTTNLQGAEQDAAVDQLLKDILISGVYFVSPESGILVTVGDYICNSPEMQKYQQDIKIEKDRINGIWQIPAGPTYINPK